MRSFWDERARESALYFVDNRLDYRNPDEAAFWSGGESALLEILASVGVAVSPDDDLLEIGCGVGRMTRPLARRASAVLALDVSSEMLARARQLNPGLDNVEWLLGDGMTLGPVENRSIDGCVSLVVFQHLPDPALTLGYVREIGRVLRPGGWAVFQVSNDPGIHRRREVGALGRVKMALGREPRGQDDPAWLGSAVDPGELCSTAEAAGMVVEQTIGEGGQYCIVRLRRT